MTSVIHLKDFDPATYPIYFFDANIWIALLKQNNLNKKEKGFSEYIDLFEAIVQLNSISDPKIVKRIKNQPKIAITSMLLSEIINAYLRKVAMPAYLNGVSGHFKKDYRENIYSDYNKQLQIIVSDLQSYSSIYTFIDDSFNSLNPCSLLSSINSKIDFNDLYYLSLMEKHSITIVTHDKDFSSNKLTILTSNPCLLSKH